MLLLVVVSRAKHLRSATILEEDVEDEDEDEDDVEAKPLAATRRANMNFLMEQKTLWEKNLRLPHKTARTHTHTHTHTPRERERERERGRFCFVTRRDWLFCIRETCLQRRRRRR